MQDIRTSGLYKDELVIGTPQGPEVQTPAGPMINFCANNYLGLANHPDVLQAVASGVQQYGFGMASVRFICGTHNISQDPGAPAVHIPRHRRYDPLQLLL